MFFHDLGYGDFVRFNLESVVCPDMEGVLEKMDGNLEVTGTVVFLSDAGENKNHFAIVEVGGIVSPLIVPVEQVAVCPVKGPQIRSE